MANISMYKSMYVVVFSLVCLLLSGCGPNNNSAANDSVASYTVVDAQGTNVDMPGKPERILTLSISTDEIVLGLAPPEKLVAVDALLDDPISSNVVDLAKRVPKRISEPTVEEIVSLAPDLVIVPDWDNITAVNSLRDLGIKVVVCKGAKNLGEIKETIGLLSEAIGEPARGEALVNKMDARLAEVAKKVEQIPEGDRKTVLLISLMRAYGGIGCSFDEACQYAGVVNGMATAGIRYGQVMSKEQMIAIDPDILFLPTYNNNGAFDISAYRQQFLDDPALANMKAVREGNMKEPNESYIYSCSQNFALGVQEIAYMAYGDAFAQPKGDHISALD